MTKLTAASSGLPSPSIFASSCQWIAYHCARTFARERRLGRLRPLAKVQLRSSTALAMAVVFGMLAISRDSSVHTRPFMKLAAAHAGISNGAPPLCAGLARSACERSTRRSPASASSLPNLARAH